MTTNDESSRENPAKPREERRPSPAAFARAGEVLYRALERLAVEDEAKREEER